MSTYARITGNNIVDGVIESSFDMTNPAITGDDKGGSIPFIWVYVDPSKTIPVKGWIWNQDKPATFSPPPPVVLTYTQAKANLDSIFAYKEALGVYFNVNGTDYLFASDTNAQSKAQAAYMMVTNNLWTDGKIWLTATGVGVPFTSVQVQELVLGMLAYIEGCQNNYASLLIEVQADTTTDITQGWPGQTIS